MKTVLLLAVALLLSLSDEAFGNTGWKSYSDLFAEVSVKTGVAASELAAIAAIESSFRPGVRAKTSTATGLFQFTSRTWRVTLQSYGAKYGLNAEADRRDPLANALMGAEYIKENRRVLKKKMGRYASLADVYLAHLIAPRRVAALEDINPKASMAYLYPNLAKYNYNIFYNKDGSARTVKEFKRYIGGKVWRAYNKYLEPAKLAVVEWERERNAKIFAKAMQVNETPWDCASKPLIRKWGSSFKEQSLKYALSYLNVSTYSVALNDNNQRREPSSGSVNRVLYLDRRWYV